MKTDKKLRVFAYLRLSREECDPNNKAAESDSITNQRNIIEHYCHQHGYDLLHTFTDDGWSGGNFERPGFKAMLEELEKGLANAVITKDLSRLGRDMTDASYYAEQYFPEHGIRYLTVSDNFDSQDPNVFAPFQFAMNEIYIRDGSRKVKEVLSSKRQRGEYCACPPFGYKKDPEQKGHLVPDDQTAPTVRLIFGCAADGDSARTIAAKLNDKAITPPLKYRVLYRDDFGPAGAARASDKWNYTTVKRILKNEVYLGHTLLGRSQTVSVKSKKKRNLSKEDWDITYNTHEPLVSQEEFDRARINMGKGTKSYQQYDQVRKSIFSGIIFCARCGHALCSSGTVYKGEREKYWYLSCINHRPDITNPCEGVRIRYWDLMELVRQDLNRMMEMSPDEVALLTQQVIDREFSSEKFRIRKAQVKNDKDRLDAIDRTITKMYRDNAEGRLEDDRLYRMLSELERESAAIRQRLADDQSVVSMQTIEDNYAKFFSLISSYSFIKVLDRETLLTFVERIEVGPKELPEGVKAITHKEQPYYQRVRIVYKFIGEIGLSTGRSSHVS